MYACECQLTSQPAKNLLEKNCFVFFSGYHSETIMYLGKLMDVRICLGEIS